MLPFVTALSCPVTLFRHVVLDFKVKRITTEGKSNWNKYTVVNNTTVMEIFPDYKTGCMIFIA
jgi:hypothetical protein